MKVITDRKFISLCADGKIKKNMDTVLELKE